MPQYPYEAYNNDLGAVVTLAAASASGNSALLANGTARGVRVAVNITAITGTTPTLTVTVQGYDSASASYYTLLASAALAATGMTVLTIYPGGPVAANVSANNNVPLNWRVSYTIAGTTPAVTGTIGAALLV